MESQRDNPNSNRFRNDIHSLTGKRKIKQIYLNVKNTGSDVAIIEVFVNGKPIFKSNPTGTVVPDTPILMKSGDESTIVLNFSSLLASGMAYEIRI